MTFLVLPGLGYGTWVWIKVARAMRRYWDRSPTSAQWSATFAGVDTETIRAFLELFVDAFAFSRKRAFCFAPDDRLCEIYDALYPCGSRGAGGEMTALYGLLRARYKVSPAAQGFADLSLGDLFRIVISNDSGEGFSGGAI